MKPDSVELVLNLLQKSLSKGTFKMYYDGDPDLIPSFNLPACVVTKTSDTEVSGTIAEDDVTETIVIKAVLNKKDDWTANVEPTNLTEKKLRRIMEARDKVTGRFLPPCVKGAVRKGLDGDRRIGESMSLELGVQIRPNDLVTAEAHLTIELKYSLDVT